MTRTYAKQMFNSRTTIVSSTLYPPSTSTGNVVLRLVIRNPQNNNSNFVASHQEITSTDQKFNDLFEVQKAFKKLELKDFVFPKNVKEMTNNEEKDEFKIYMGSSLKFKDVKKAFNAEEKTESPPGFITSTPIFSEVKTNLRDNPSLLSSVESMIDNKQIDDQECLKDFIRNSKVYQEASDSLNHDSLNQLEEGLITFLERSSANFTQKLANIINIINSSPSWLIYIEKMKELFSQSNFDLTRDVLSDYSEDLWSNMQLVLLLGGIKNLMELDHESLDLLLDLIQGRSQRFLLNSISSFGIVFLRDLIQSSENIQQLIQHLKQLQETYASFHNASYPRFYEVPVVSEFSENDLSRINNEMEEISNINFLANSSITDTILRLIKSKFSDISIAVLRPIINGVLIAGSGVALGYIFSLIFYTLKLSNRVVLIPQEYHPQTFKELLQGFLSLLKDKLGK